MMFLYLCVTYASIFNVLSAYIHTSEVYLTKSSAAAVRILLKWMVSF